MPVKTVEIDGKQVIIACTPDEANDRSYMDYLKEGVAERSREKQSVPKKVSSVPKKDVSGALKEYAAWREKRRESVNRKYY